MKKALLRLFKIPNLSLTFRSSSNACRSFMGKLWLPTALVSCVGLSIPFAAEAHSLRSCRDWNRWIPGETCLDRRHNHCEDGTVRAAPVNFPMKSPPDCPPASRPPANNDSSLLFKLKNDYNYNKILHVRFYNVENNLVWPASDRAYVIDNHKTHSYRLNCKSGAKICYGAWIKNDPSTIWGLGRESSNFTANGCESCCGICGAVDIRSITLTDWRALGPHSYTYTRFIYDVIHLIHFPFFSFMSHFLGYLWTCLF